MGVRLWVLQSWGGENVKEFQCARRVVTLFVASNDWQRLYYGTAALVAVAVWTVLRTVSVAVTDYLVVCLASFCLVVMCFKPLALSVCINHKSQWVQANFVLISSQFWIASHWCGISTEWDNWLLACCIVQVQFMLLHDSLSVSILQPLCFKLSNFFDLTFIFFASHLVKSGSWESVKYIG